MTTLAGITEAMLAELGSRVLEALVDENKPSVVQRWGVLGERAGTALIAGDLRRIERIRSKGHAA